MTSTSRNWPPTRAQVRDRWRRLGVVVKLAVGYALLMFSGLAGLSLAGASTGWLKVWFCVELGAGAVFTWLAVVLRRRER